MPGKPKHKGKARARAKARAKGKAKGLGKVTPGVLLSWEDFNEEAMRDFLQELTSQIEDELDAQEQAFRCEN